MENNRQSRPLGNWEAVGNDTFRAMQEVAGEIGGEDFAQEVTNTALYGNAVLPNPESLILMEQVSPGSVETVMARAKEIQTERHEAELNQLLLYRTKGRLKRFGKALIDANTLIWTGGTESHSARRR